MLEDVVQYLQHYQDLHKSDGLLAIVISDREGVPLLKTADEEAPSLALRPSFISPYAMVNDQASKLGLGRNKTMVSIYSTNQIIHFDKSPFIVTLIGTEKANTGLLLELEEQFDLLLNKLTPVVDS